MRKTIHASLLAALFANGILPAKAEMQTNEVLVTANRFERSDTETTYASEIHTAAQIEASGATSLYEYLSQQTSINVLPFFGNKASPSIDMRGYGSENGYQNIVVTVDGQRLNNIDQTPQLLGTIPLGNIERIEITKGTGSVVYGDGAMAGTIQIYTKNRTGVSVSASAGNYGALSGYASAGLSEEYFDLSASAAHDSNDGIAKKDASGHRDEFTNNTQNVKLKIKPTDTLRFNLEGTSARSNIFYVNPLTKAAFKDDPRNVGLDFLGNKSNYAEQDYDTDQWRVGGEYEITSQFKISATHYREDKRSEFVNFGSVFNYDYDSNDLALTYAGEELSVLAGYQTFEGERLGTGNKTSKDNQAVYIHTEYMPAWLIEGLTLSAGARNEKVKYHYAASATSLEDASYLDTWDIGANYRINEASSLFANYNQAYQAPDIDRFFSTNFFTGVTTFNGFIKPARAKTLNLGMNHATPRQHLKLTAFYADLENEIYFNAVTFTNTNIDKSHKYGLELQEHWQINPKLAAGVIYTYTRAIIDREADLGSGVNGNNLPGVPRNSVVANLNYQFTQNANINLSHTWRESTYALNDINNNFSQKQGRYESTNLAMNYRYQHYQLFASINNIFEHENSLQVADDVIYPVDFARTWRVGVKIDM